MAEGRPIRWASAHATPEQLAERLDAAVLCPWCGYPSVLVVAPAMWSVIEWGDGSWCLGMLWGTGDSYPVAKTDRALCNRTDCEWAGTLGEVKVRRKNDAHVEPEEPEGAGGGSELGDGDPA